MITRDNEDDGQVDRQPLGVVHGSNSPHPILGEEECNLERFHRGEGVEFLPARHRGFDCLPAHPIPAAQTTPPAMSVMPAMNRIVSARVSNQLLRMLRLNRWTAPGRVVSIR